MKKKSRCDYFLTAADRWSTDLLQAISNTQNISSHSHSVTLPFQVDLRLILFCNSIFGPHHEPGCNLLYLWQPQMRRDIRPPSHYSSGAFCAFPTKSPVAARSAGASVACRTVLPKPYRTTLEGAPQRQEAGAAAT